jgi:hypothetical protein
MSDQRERHERLLLEAYRETGAYDRHYSTVRTGTSTFLVTVGLSIGAFFAEHGAPALGLYLALIIFLFAIVLNLRFQMYTAACHALQIEIEKALDDSATTDCIRFRSQFQDIIKNRQVYYYIDFPAGILLVGILAYFVAMAIYLRSWWLVLAVLVVGGALWKLAEWWNAYVRERTKAEAVCKAGDEGTSPPAGPSPRGFLAWLRRA